MPDTDSLPIKGIDVEGAVGDGSVAMTLSPNTDVETLLQINIDHNLILNPC